MMRIMATKTAALLLALALCLTAGDADAAAAAAAATVPPECQPFELRPYWPLYHVRAPAYLTPWRALHI